MQRSNIDLMIRKMTKEQFKTITPEVGELDFIIDEDYSLNKSARNVGEIIPSVIPLTDAGLHLLDGALINGSGIYSGFVDYIADLYGDGTAVPDYFCTETEWQTAVTTYGVCGKFVYDSTNNTVRLPKITGIIEGTTDVTALGDLVEAGLPNIVGNLDFYSGGGTGTGAITYTKNSRENNPGGGDMLGNCTLNFNASRSSAIYGNSTTVQPQTIKVLYYIVLATSIKSDVEIDLEKVLEEIDNLTGKSMFDVVPKDHILSYEETKGFAQLGSYVYKEAVAGSRYGYPDFYSKVIAEYQDQNNTTETVSGVTITVNANGHKFYDIADKADIDSLFTTRGEAWFYGIDTTNERIFLPRSTRIKFGDASTVGDYQEAGLPNITGTFQGGRDPENIYQSGAFNKYQDTSTQAGTGYYQTRIDFDASRSSSIYGNSNTVEYSSTKLVPYMVVGNTTVEGAIGEYIDVTTTENDTLPLFYGAYFDYTPNNVSWVLAGGQIASGTIYEFAYNELVNELSTPKYGLQVIEEDDMVVGVDYSTYWKVNQDQQYFIAPIKLSYGAYDLINGTVPVKGNGMTLGLTDGTTNYGLVQSGGNVNRLDTDTAGYGVNVGSSFNGSSSSGKTVGVTTDGTKSGMVADLSNTQSTAKLYFKVANAVQNLELLDAGEVLEAVNGVASTVANTPHITETYVNGTSWYRVYSDGWCEQGGITNLSNQGTITLLKNYINTNYIVELTQNASTYDYTYCSAYSKTTSSFQVSIVAGTSGTSGDIGWIARGYIR